MAPHPIARWLTRLLRDPKTEALRGDLDESFARALADGQSPRRARRAHLLDVLRSLAAWWSPRAVAARRRAARHDAAIARRRTVVMHLTGLSAEMRQTLRGLVRRPGRTALITMTLAIGIAATTTIYSVVDAVLIRPLPYEGGDRLVLAGRVFPDRPWRADAPHLQQLAGTSIATFMDWRERLVSFDALEAVEPRSLLLPDTGRGPELASAASVTSGFLDLLGARVMLGRDLQPADFVEGTDAVMLLGHAAWVTRYGSADDIIGRTAGGATIVGVLSAEFEEPEAVFGGPVEFWQPLSPKNLRYLERGRRSSFVVGRLAEGVTLDAARAELTAAQARLSDEYPEDNVFPDGSVFGAGVNLLHAQTVGGSAGPLTVFFGGATLLLLIAALNSATLLLLRGLEREGELALRRAIGADRVRLVVGLLLEGVVFAVIGGLAGVLLATAGVQAFLQVGPSSIPRLDDVTLNARVLSASAALSLGAGLFAALVPALRLAGHANLGTGLRLVASPTTTSSSSGLRAALVAGQLAAALVLGVSATLLMSSLVRLSSQDLGFDPEGLTAIAVPLKSPVSSPTDAAVDWDRALAEVRTIAGIEQIAAASDAPFEDSSWAPWVRLPDDPPDRRREGVVAFVVTPGFFEAVGTSLVAGRDFATGDSPTSERVVIVNEAFVRTHLSDRDPLAASVHTRADDGTTIPWRVVGVASDIVQRRVEDDVAPALYVSYQQEAWPFGVNVLVRSDRSGDTFTDELRQAVGRFNPYVPISRLYPLSSRLSAALVEPTFRTAMFGAFAAVSVLLAVVGLYGSLSHTVGRRTRELSVRMALGADRWSIFVMVLRQGAVVAATGLALGLGGAVVVTRWLHGFLFGVSALDPVAFIAAACAVGSVALLATLSPARRATRVDITRSLKE